MAAFKPFENGGSEGSIINNGTITVGSTDGTTARSGGFAAFVAPNVQNNGIINAKMGTVVMAAGEKVTLDLYGDNLVNVAVDGALENALIENKGTIKAEGGNVVITAAAAKNVVDNIINMDGIVDVSSVSTKGGKIVLNGGSKGVVKVAGKLNANGKDGGAVKITGQNILSTETSTITASALTAGNGGSVDLVADDALAFGGSIEAKGGALAGNGGAVDTSGKNAVDIYGSVDASAYNGTAGTWLIDPSNLRIVSGSTSNATTTNPFSPTGGFFSGVSTVKNTAIETALNGGTNVTITTVGSADKLLQDGSISIEANITKSAGPAETTLNILSAGSITSDASSTISAAAGYVLNVVMNAVNNVLLSGDVKTNGGDFTAVAQKGNFTLFNGGLVDTSAASGVGGDIKVNADGAVVTLLSIPVTGTLATYGVLNAGGGNINLHQSAVFDGDVDSIRTSGTGTITMNQNKVGFAGSIQDSIDAVQNTGTGTNTINVGAGTYKESLKIAEDNFILNGANAGKTGYDVTRGAESIIDPNSPGFYVTGDNAVIDGFTITSTSGVDGEGVWVDNGAANATVTNNVINDISQNGIKFSNTTGGGLIKGNKIDDTGFNGVAVIDGAGTYTVTENEIGVDSALTGIYGNGVYAQGITGGTISKNKIRNTIQDEPEGNNASGVYIFKTDGVTVGGPAETDANDIADVQWDGVKVEAGTGNIVQNNVIENTTRVGIWAIDTNDLHVLSNKINNTNITAGIGIYHGDGVEIDGNIVSDTSGVVAERGDGISVNGTTGVITITDNIVGKEDGSTFIVGNGIALYGVTGAKVQRNEVYYTKTVFDDRASGIYVSGGNGNLIGGPETDEDGNFVNGNKIRNANWDGVKVTLGNGDIVQGNDIAQSTRVGIWGYLTNGLQVLNNLVVDSNVTAGIGIYQGNDVNIAGNKVLDTSGPGFDDRGDGISVNGTTGVITVTDNTVGAEDDSSAIIGNGIALYNVSDAKVQRNDIFNTKTIIEDRASGVYVFNGFRNLIGGPETDEDGNFVNGNYIRGADWDGVKVTLGNGNIVQGNDIAHSTRVGIWGYITTALQVLDNLVVDSNTTAGIGTEYSHDVNIARNKVLDTFGMFGERGDGISVRDTTGVITITDNVVGEEGDTPATFISGNGIALYNIDGAVVQRNDIFNTKTTVDDRASGIYVFKGTNNLIGGSETNEEGEFVNGNSIRNADWDGIKVDGGGDNHILGNDVAHSTRVGIWGINTDGIEIGYNTVLDSNLTAGIGVYYSKGLNIYENDVMDSVGDGIGAYFDQEPIFIINNTVDLSTWDGIHVHDFSDALIQANTVSRSGDDGIEAHDGNSVEIDGNTVSQSGIGFVIPDEEEPEDYGSTNDEFYGNHDGISVRQMKGVYVESEELPIFDIFALDYDDYAPASVRITNNKVSAGEQNARVIGNGGVSVSEDDGIEVVDVDGYVYINNNSVENSGTDGESAYGNYGVYGADGIHVRNVFANGDISSVVREGDVGDGEYNIVVSNNVINNSLDDGIEILGSYSKATAAKVALIEEGEEEENEGDYYSDFGYGPTGRVLVKDNTVSNSGWGNPSDGFGQSAYYYSGGDGIHVQDIYPEVEYTAGSSEDGEFVGYAVDILHNTVSNSGDDGIDVEYSSSTLIDDNTVSNSGLTVDGEGEGDGFNTADWYGSDGIFVNNVGEEYYEYGDDEGDDEGEGSLQKIALSGLIEGDTYTPYSVVIRRNDVTNSKDDGIQVNNDMDGWIIFNLFEGGGYVTPPVLIGGNNPGDGNTVINSGNHGLYISGPGHDNVIVSGNAFSTFDIGAEFESGLIDLTGATNTFDNGRVGLRFAPYQFFSEGAPSFANLNLVDDDAPGSTPYPTIPTNFGGTIGSQIFSNISQYYVELEDNAFTHDGEDYPIWINGLNSAYDGLRPADTAGALSQADFDNLEARFYHFPDEAGRDIFWFGFAVPDIADIDQSQIFNYFSPFNGDLTGLNVRITGLPSIGGGGTPANFFPNIVTAAGGTPGGSNPGDLNSIATAAGGDNTATAAEDLNAVETQAGGDQRCWSNAANIAGSGQTVNVVYNGSFDDNLDQAESCGASF